MKGALPWPVRREAPHYDFLTLLKRKDWHAQARCAHHPSVDYRWFFSERSSGQRESARWTDAETKAKVACAKCPVRAECLLDGLYEPAGIWGGTLPSERRRWRHVAGCEKGTVAKPRDHIACITDQDQVDLLLDEMDDQAVDRGLIGRTEEVA